MTTTEAVKLGNFSVSLAVKDLEASRAFYHKLGFAAVAGDAKVMPLLEPRRSA